MEVRLPCRLAGCEKCCYNTHMTLTPRDVERLEALGYKLEEFAVCEEGVCRLRNVDGHCYFLEPGRGCRVYRARPLGCRLYPVVCVEGEGLAVDAVCPLALLALNKLRSDRRLVAAIAELISRELGVRCPPRLLGLVDTEAVG